MSLDDSALLDTCFNSLTSDTRCKLFSICDLKMKSNPLIFHSDSDDLTADISPLCKYYNSGDLCTEINIILMFLVYMSIFVESMQILMP